jgi:hypothetical protein
MSSAFETALAIDKLKELRPDWDSYGAGEIMLSAREQAKRFIEHVERTLGAQFADPIVGPTADGGVVLIWRHKPGLPKVEAFFSPVGDQRYVVLRERTVLAQGPIKDSEFIRQHVTL